jgi:hypothetical protein
MKTISAKNMPLRAIKCATCPFRADSPYANLAPELALSAMRDASRICHSTGSRCRCGCGRIARWPLESNEPVFYTRLCGYKMALKIVRDLELEQA